jgi:chromosomal replication initiation ATPase DnaA
MSFQVFNPAFERRIWAKRRHEAANKPKPKPTLGEMVAEFKAKQKKPPRRLERAAAAGPAPDYPGRESVSAIIERVAEAHSVSVSEMMASCRFAPLVRARQAAMLEIVRVRPDLSLAQIGRSFGGRDHSSVINALRKVGIDHTSADWQATREAA